MTIHSKRRGRRSLAAILAAMLMASVLAVVAGSPAQAANTAEEAGLVDHDSNADTAKVREFAGVNRYDTALRLAKKFTLNRGGIGTVRSVLIASGETLVDSISAAGLAGYLDGPVLLTPTGSLHDGVKDFIEDWDVRDVRVLGGEAAISDDAMDALKALTSKPTVTRHAGPDRYATAAAVAGEISAVSSWCGTVAKSAVLINGETGMLPFGVAVGTYAYRLQLPVLMTKPDMLPDATADFIRDADIEHVQIIGGTGTVSAAVASAVSALGVDTVARTDGDSAAAVSVALAKLAGNGCGDDLTPVSDTHVVLVRGNPDGVAAAAVLASSLDNGRLVTPLIVGDTLPAPVRDHLAATPQAIGGDKLNLQIVAVGGLKAVTQAVMDAALTAAVPAPEITVQIGADSDTNDDDDIDANDPLQPTSTAAVLRLYFSDDVETTTTDLVSNLRDVLEVNGVPADVASAAALTCSTQAVTVTLGTPLAAGDVVSVASSAATRFGTGTDARSVAAASATVQAAPPGDSLKPAVEIIGIDDDVLNVFYVRATDAGGAPTGSLDEDDFVFTASTSRTTPATAIDITAAAGTAVGNTRSWTVQVGNVVSGTFTATPVVAGDTLTLKAGHIMDQAGNLNAARPGRAIAAQANPKVAAVEMSELAYSAPNVWDVPNALDAGSSGVADRDDSLSTRVPGDVVITARDSGDAAGAAGNDWDILFDVLPDTTPSRFSATQPVDIDVRVDPRGQRVTVRHNSGEADVGDLLDALNGNSAFAERFTAGFTNGGCPANARDTLMRDITRGVLVRNTVVLGDALTDPGLGRTRFAIEVAFKIGSNAAYIEDFTITGGTNEQEVLMDAVLARAAARAEAPDGSTLFGDLTTVSGLGLTPAFSAPQSRLRFVMEASDVDQLPRDRDLVDIGAGTADNSRVAGGYDSDPAADEHNAASKILLTQTSRVTAP